VLCFHVIPKSGQSQAVEIGGEVVQRSCVHLVVNRCLCKVGLVQPIVRANPRHGVKRRAKCVGVDGAVTFPHAFLEQFDFLLIGQVFYVDIILFVEAVCGNHSRAGDGAISHEWADVHDSFVVEGMVVEDVVAGIFEEQVGKRVIYDVFTAHVLCDGGTVFECFLFHGIVVGFLGRVTVARVWHSSVNDSVCLFALCANVVDGGDFVDACAGFHLWQCDFIKGTSFKDGAALVGMGVHPHDVCVRQLVSGIHGNDQSFKDVCVVPQRSVVIFFKVCKEMGGDNLVGFLKV